MNPELGLISLIIAFCIALAQGIIPLIGSYKLNPIMMSACKPLAAAQFIFILISFISLVIAFISDDFSVQYVANNSSSILPVYYKITATWGSHEGSLLLWILILSVWIFSVSLFSKQLPLKLLSRILAVLGWVSIGFLAFILFTSNPFSRFLPFSPTQGSDLNPLLQDFGMIIHPPMLYMGYVGFSVAFAFAIAALLEGKLDSAWAKWVRPWTMIAWSFLTIGIALGSWWAYYELGWGGWWFWDPVENASLMPWLSGTALIHSLAVTEKRGLFKSWTTLLAITTFSLSLLGTFLVRSGILTSVHTFANDPERGLFILIYLLIIIGISLLIFTIKAPSVNKDIYFNWLSRETFLLINNILLIISTATVLLGTLFPLIVEAFNLGKISVGPPYFNMIIPPLTFISVFFLGIGILLNWKQNKASWLIRELKWSFVLALLAGFLYSLYIKKIAISETITIVLVIWVIINIIQDVIKKTRHTTFLQGLQKLKPSYYSMQIGHLGFILIVFSIMITSNYSIEKDVSLAPSDKMKISGYIFQFDGVLNIQGSNYNAERGIIKVFQNNKHISTLYPEKRIYYIRSMPMTETAIQPLLMGDIYVALGEPLKDNYWSIRIHIKPMVRGIWLGAFLMSLSGFITIIDRRFRKKQNISQRILLKEHRE